MRKVLFVMAAVLGLGGFGPGLAADPEPEKPQPTTQPKPSAPAKPGAIVGPKVADPVVPPTPDFGALGLSPCRVVEILDGKSVVVQAAKGQEVVSLLGVDEVKPADSAAPASRTLTDALRDLTTGEAVYIVDHETGPRTDARGRRACYVYRAPDGLMLNLEVIRQGYAAVNADFAYQFLETFKLWHKRAVSAGRGLYTVAGSPTPTDANGGSAKPADKSGTEATSIAPATGTQVYVTRSGTKYHEQSCRFAHGATAVSLKDAKAKGLTACTQCNPPK